MRNSTGHEDKFRGTFLTTIVNYNWLTSILEIIAQRNDSNDRKRPC